MQRVVLAPDMSTESQMPLPTMAHAVWRHNLHNLITASNYFDSKSNFHMIFTFLPECERAFFHSEEFAQNIKQQHDQNEAVQTWDGRYHLAEWRAHKFMWSFQCISIFWWVPNKQCNTLYMHKTAWLARVGHLIFKIAFLDPNTSTCFSSAGHRGMPQ